MSLEEEKKTIDDSKSEAVEGFAVGKLINGKYVIEKQLGVGGMGLTYLAHDADNINRKLVIKTIFKILSTTAGKAAFLREGEALGRIGHDGVVKLFDKGEDTETTLPFLVMEYCEGIMLSEIIKRGKMNFNKAFGISRKIAFALNAAHEKGILHRDLKPDNVMVVESEIEEDKIKLIDFGIAKIADSVVSGDSTQFGTFKGTIQYSSPEQLTGFQTVTGETFNLAVLTYEMLTNTHPFQIDIQRNENESNDSFTGRRYYRIKDLQRIGAKPPNKFNSEIQSATAQVLLKGLEYESVNRYQTPIEFVEALKNSLIVIEPEIPIVPDDVIQTQSNIWKKILPIAAVFTLLAIGLLGFALWSYVNQNVPKIAISKSSPTPTISPIVTPQIPETLFSYSYEVQKMKNNLIDGKPFETNDKSQIALGDKFNLKLKLEKDGHFYIVEQNGDDLKLAFSNGEQNAKAISTWRVSKQNQAFWLIWSKSKVDALENWQSSEAKQFLETNEKSSDSKELSGKIEVQSNKDVAIYKLSQ